jgi:hypothetical protein
VFAAWADCDAESMAEEDVEDDDAAWPFAPNFEYAGLGSGRGYREHIETSKKRMAGLVMLYTQWFLHAFQRSKHKNDERVITVRLEITFWSFCNIQTSSLSFVMSFVILSTSRTRCWIVLSRLRRGKERFVSNDRRKISTN